MNGVMYVKIIFLDMDGVILSGPDLWNSSYIPRNRTIPQDKIELLKKLCDATDAKVVVSSTWRSDENTRDRLRDLGVPLHEDWRTCHSWTPEFTEAHQGRGYQVQLWLNKHPEVTKFVCLDDDDDFIPDQPVVYTDFMVGLTELDILEAEVILNG